MIPFEPNQLQQNSKTTATTTWNKNAWPKQNLYFIQWCALGKLCFLMSLLLLEPPKIVAALPTPKGNEKSRGKSSPISWGKMSTSSLYGAGKHTSVLFSLLFLPFLPCFPLYLDSIRAYIKHCTLYKQLYRESSTLSSLGCVVVEQEWINTLKLI